MIICRIVIFEMTIYAVFFGGSLARRRAGSKQRQPATKWASRFLQHGKKQWQKEKFLTGKFICQSQEVLFAGMQTVLVKGKKMVARAGIEPTTNCLEGSCSIH